VQHTLLQYASKGNMQTRVQSGENYVWHFPVYGRSRPKHVVSEGLITLVEDKRPEANHLIEL